MRIKRRVVAGALMALGAVACGDPTNPLTGRGQNVSLSFAGRTPGAPLSSTAGLSASVLAAGDSLVLNDGTNTLIIRSVEVLLREIELKRLNTPDCDSTLNSDACEKFEVGATLVNVPLGAGTAVAFTVAIDSGTYTEIEFDIHKLGGDSVDAAFAAANPTWPANTSIRVTGSYNGTAFTFTTSLDAEEEIALVPPLVIDASGSTTNVTMRLDVTTWFRNGTAGPFVNPATANQGGANQSLVENNIKNSIKAFRDHDRDGDDSDG